MKIRYLRFLNTELQPGVNVTVRRGAKWSMVSPGEPLVIEDALPEPSQPIAMAEVVSSKLIKFTDIPVTDLQLEHDSTCRTLQGLFAAMRRAYSDFSVDEVVTVLTFKTVELQ